MAVLVDIMIQNECCIIRCDGLIYKDQEDPRRNTGNQNKRKPTVMSTGIKYFK